jgi:hypothetical protein
MGFDTGAWIENAAVSYNPCTPDSTNGFDR